METSKSSVPEREFGLLRNGQGGFHVLPQSLQALPESFGLRRLCPWPHPRKFRRHFFFGPFFLSRDRS